ncbi:MAG: NAD-dependent epimerase/dehydratase family protein [Chthoniobacterales bacterium]
MPKVLIAGCGFVGETAAGLFMRRGWDVVGLTSSERTDVPNALKEASGVEGAGAFTWAHGDLGDSASVADVVSAAGMFDVVVHCASSKGGGVEGYRRVYRDGIRHLVESCLGARVVLTGSTSVYGQADGAEVDEGSVTEPDRQTGRVLLEAEGIALGAGGTVARLAGLYGPGRSVMMRKFLEGTAVLENGGGRWINQIHRNDAASAIVHLTTTSVEAGVYNAVDDAPATQREVYGWLAEYYDRPLPPAGPANANRKRGNSNKRVLNGKLRATGWVAEFASYREGLSDISQG